MPNWPWPAVGPCEFQGILLLLETGGTGFISGSCWLQEVIDVHAMAAEVSSKRDRRMGL
jgi:hypothetical protein